MVDRIGLDLVCGHVGRAAWLQEKRMPGVIDIAVDDAVAHPVIRPGDGLNHEIACVEDPDLPGYLQAHIQQGCIETAGGRAVFHKDKRVGYLIGPVEPINETVRACRSRYLKDLGPPGLPAEVSNFIKAFDLLRAQRKEKQSIKPGKIITRDLIPDTGRGAEEKTLAPRQNEQAGRSFISPARLHRKIGGPHRRSWSMRSPPFILTNRTPAS